MIERNCIRPNKLTLMVLVGARTTFPPAPTFFYFEKKIQKNSKKKNLKTKKFKK